MIKPKLTLRLSNIFVLVLGFQCTSYLSSDSKKHNTLYINFLIFELGISLYRSYHE